MEALRVINPFVNSFSFIARSVTNTALAICTSAIKSSQRQQAYVKCKLQTERSASILVTLTMLDSSVCELKLILALVTMCCHFYLTWHWRSSAGGAERGRCRRLSRVWVKRGAAAHYLSRCCRRSPHSSCSGAVQTKTSKRAFS